MMKYFLFLFLLIHAETFVFAQNDESLKAYKNEVLSMELFKDYDRVDLSRYDKKLASVFIKSDAYRYQINFDKEEKIEGHVRCGIVVSVFYSDNEATRQVDMKKHIKRCLDYHKSKEVEWNGITFVESRTKLHPSYGDVLVITLFLVKEDHLIYVEFWSFPNERKRQEENAYEILSSIRLNGSLKELYNAAQK